MQSFKSATTVLVVAALVAVSCFGVGWAVGRSTAECCSALAGACDFADDLMEAARVTCLACPGMAVCEALQRDQRGPELCGDDWGAGD